MAVESVGAIMVHATRASKESMKVSTALQLGRNAVQSQDVASTFVEAGSTNLAMTSKHSLSQAEQSCGGQTATSRLRNEPTINSYHGGEGT